MNTKSRLSFTNGIGFLFGYLIFTTVLYFILTFLDKLPQTWDIYDLAIITAIIAAVGYWLKEEVL